MKKEQEVVEREKPDDVTLSETHQTISGMTTVKTFKSTRCKLSIRSLLRKYKD